VTILGSAFGCSRTEYEFLRLSGRLPGSLSYLLAHHRLTRAAMWLDYYNRRTVKLRFVELRTQQAAIVETEVVLALELANSS
jgi:hypothetical protein